MRNQVQQLLLLSLFSIGIVTGCGRSNDSVPAQPTNTFTQSESMSNEPSQSKEVTEPSVTEKVPLLPHDISYYDGSAKLDGLEGQNTPATFKRHRDLPYGFYFLDTMEEYVLEDGTEWGMDNQRSLFSLFTKDQAPFESNYTNPSLAQYSEYAGTEKDDSGSYYDYFKIIHKGNELLVRLHYFEQDKETTLPLFLDILKNIRYVADPTSFQAGIAIDFPKGADDDEEAVILLVRKNIEAIVKKDKAAFRSTLVRDNDFLDYMVGSNHQYRFTKMTLIRPDDIESGRMDIQLEYEFLDDGIVKYSGNTVVSLKGKDGKWKIADID
ncbi:hypothetical protein [Cohnella silvisoli]|uniref:DUF4878 domain-containing protein n=1 Tax=Cohnella silvisoli TaxID=2873699 RepID=A0ABV1KY63_9BACL|nr:hypothetical protein [Cohnella silvisoli]MCD9021820.1 hypothetical protein [Cohnella silvisoli]